MRPVTCGVVAVALMSALVAGVPYWVMRPFVPQDPGALALALWLRRAGPWLAPACAALACALALAAWRGARGPGPRAGLVAAVAVALVSTAAARVNPFERMFHPRGLPSFGSVESATLDPRDMVLAVRAGGEAKAYPVRQLAYHHLVNDVVGGAPIVATYCTLCHSGVVWGRVVGGRVLTFRLAGINNQNMLMQDEETGTFWQQVTGQALAGPLAGSMLPLARADEMSFGQYRRESPDGRVLTELAADANRYAPPDWEDRIAKLPVTVPDLDPTLAPRELVVGIEVAGEARAYPVALVRARAPLEDDLAGTAVVLVMAADGLSIRAFVRPTRDGGPLDVYAAPDAGDELVDALGARRGFDGCVLPDRADCLAPLPVLREYWFDWRNHHPRTSVYRGAPERVAP